MYTIYNSLSHSNIESTSLLITPLPPPPHTPPHCSDIDSAPCFDMLRHMIAKGDTTVYEYRRKEAPSSVETAADLLSKYSVGDATPTSNADGDGEVEV